MYKLNFLPAKVKEKHYKQRVLFKSIMILVLLIMNVFFSLRLYSMFYELNNYKKKAENSINKKSFVINYKNSNKNIDFLFYDIIPNFNCDQVTINDENIDIKLLIKDKTEFIDDIRKFENIKECTIKYINPPYDESGKYKFEIGLECIK